jgi:tetratricopeptide (TPR) repeat protein
MQDVVQSLEQAREIWTQGDRTRTYAIYEQLLKEYPDNPLVWCEYGKAVYTAFDDLEAATVIFERVLALKPDSIVARLYLSELYSAGYGKGYPAALPLYLEVIQLASDKRNDCHNNATLAAYVGIGMLYRKPGSPVSYDEMLNAFRKAIEIDPSSVMAHQDLAMALYEGGRFQEAWHEFKITEHLLRESHQSTEYLQKYLKRVEQKEAPVSTMYGGVSIGEWPQDKLCV